jgi:hypothetical protein
LYLQRVSGNQAFCIDTRAKGSPVKSGVAQVKVWIKIRLIKDLNYLKFTIEKYKSNIRKVKKKPLNKKNQKNKQRIMENLY